MMGVQKEKKNISNKYAFKFQNGMNTIKSSLSNKVINKSILVSLVFGSVMHACIRTNDL